MTPKQSQNVIKLVEALLSNKYDHKKHDFYDVVMDSTGYDMGGWFRLYGLSRKADFYYSVNNAAKNYYAVAALLAVELPPSVEKTQLFNRLHSMTNSGARR